MASRKQLKKDIYLISSDLVTECYTLTLLFPAIKEEKINPIIADVFNLTSEFISRVNHYDGKENAAVIKKYFQSIRSDFNKKVSTIINKINELSVPEKK